MDFEQKWLDILNRKDTAALDCILAPEFADTSRKGALRPKAQVLRELTQRKEQEQYKQKLTDLQASLFGDTAVVRGVNVISDQQGHEVLRIRFTDVLHYHRWPLAGGVCAGDRRGAINLFTAEAQLQACRLQLPLRL